MNSAEFQGFSGKFRPLKNIFRTLENGHSIRHQSIPPLSAGRFEEKLNRGFSKPGGFPLFSGKVQIVSRTLSGLFLVGALNGPRKRKRALKSLEKENAQKSKGNREKQEKRGKRKKQGKEGQGWAGAEISLAFSKS